MQPAGLDWMSIESLYSFGLHSCDRRVEEPVVILYRLPSGQLEPGIMGP